MVCQDADFFWSEPEPRRTVLSHTKLQIYCAQFDDLTLPTCAGILEISPSDRDWSDRASLCVRLPATGTTGCLANSM
jgi:hypothetical protein